MDLFQILFFLFAPPPPANGSIDQRRCVLVVCFFLHTCRQILSSHQTNLLHGEQSISGEEGGTSADDVLTPSSPVLSLRPGTGGVNAVTVGVCVCQCACA